MRKWYIIICVVVLAGLLFFTGKKLLGEGDKKDQMNRAEGYYEISCSYADFALTDGKRSAQVENGTKVDGDLEIICLGNQKNPDATPEYAYKVPALSQNNSYCLTPDEAENYITTINYDEENGFFIKVSSKELGKLTVGAAGNIATEFENDNKNSISLTLNSMSTPWYIVKVSGDNNGMSMMADSDSTEIKTRKETAVEIRTEADVTVLDIQDVTANTKGISITEGEDGNCQVLDENGNIVKSFKFE